MRLFIRIVDISVPGATPVDSGDGPGAALEASFSVAWLLVDRNGALVSQGSGDPSLLGELVDLKAMNNPDDIVLLVPTEHCLSIRCTVPGRTVGQMRRALPYVVEEFLAGELEAMHIAVASVRRNVPVDALLIERTLLQGWLETLASRGVVPGHALPEAALLPASDTRATVLFDGDRVLVRSVDQMAATQIDNLSLVLESLASGSADAGIQFVLVNGQIGPIARAAVAQSTKNPIDWVDADSDVTPLAYLAAQFPGQAGTINLLQGAFSPPKSGGSNWVRLRGVAALLGVWFVVLVASETVTGVWATHRANVLTTQVEALYREYFPQDQRIQDPYKQMVAHLGGRVDNRTSFLALLGDLTAGLAANSGAQLNSVTYNDGRAELGAEVAVSGFEALEALKAAWGRAGVTVEITSAEQQDQQVQARIRLRAL